MSRNNQRRNNTIVFSFGVDSTDPKYQELINFLNEIDSGARSYVIRQILNNYIKGQTSTSAFSLITGVNTKENNEVTEETQNTSKVVEETEAPEEQENERKERKIKRDPRLDSLKNTFG